MSFVRPYKRRVVIRRYGYVDGRYQRIAEFDWQEFLKMGFKHTVFNKPNINGWNEMLSNSSGATIAYKIIVR